jgi:FkbM family methyltransferase
VKVVELWQTGERWTFVRLREALADLGYQPRHVLHVGAHLGQEVPHYFAAGIHRVTLVEPTPASVDYLRSHALGAVVLPVACGTTPGRAAMLSMGGDGCHNTLRAVVGEGEGVHQPVGSVLVEVVTVASIQADADMLVVDTQGTEVDVLASADLDPLGLVVVETQRTGHAEAAHLDDVTAHMAARGWEPVLMWDHEPDDSVYYGYADVFYRRRP